MSTLGKGGVFFCWKQMLQLQPYGGCMVQGLLYHLLTARLLVLMGLMGIIQDNQTEAILNGDRVGR